MARLTRRVLCGQVPGSGRRSVGFRALHLTALSFFAFAWPLLDLLGRNPEFFAVRGSRTADVVVLALGLTLVPPLLLLGLELLAGVGGARASRLLHLGWIGLLTAVIALLELSWIEGLPAAAAIALALAAGGAGALAYRAFHPLRTVVTLLALAPVAFLALFFFASASGRLVLPRGEVDPAAVAIARPAPVVMVVFDEFPTDSLLGRDGEIDAARFPHFAALARESTWYRNATTVDANTSRAVPAILTGRNDDGAAIASSHPRNLFTLLAGTYRIEAAEAVTRLCPESICERGSGEGFGARMRSLAADVGVVYGHQLLPESLRSRLPSISGVWGNFGTDRQRPGRNALGANFVLRNLLPGSMREREAAFDAFVRAVRPTAEPTLFFFHALLPHYPWEHVPSGRAYPEFAIPGLTTDFWTGNDFEAEQAWQRHLAQVGYVDRLLGRLVQRLRRTGLWDDALLVIVADHGVSFRAGEPRKAVTSATVSDLAFVPLFVRSPGQQRGRTVDATVSTLDILPTVADVLGIRLPWQVTGSSLAADPVPALATVRLDTNEGGVLAVSASALVRRRDLYLAAQDRLFGRTWDDLYRFGTRPDLLGRPLSRAPRAPRATAALDPQPWVATSDLVPAFVRGSVSGPGAADVQVAVAVNGRIAAVVPPYPSADGTRFSAFLPESAFRPGENDVRALAVS